MSFSVEDGVLHAESIPLPRIADAVGTPVYVYSQAALLGAYARLGQALAEAGPEPLICYAVKANGKDRKSVV